jgi:NikR C terminal nickel binding domain
VSLREPRRNLQIQSTAPLNVSGSHFRTRRAKPQRPLCPDETCMEVTALKDQAETCRHFADRTIAERGVRYGRVATTPTSAKTKRHPKAYLAIETPVVACPFRVRPGHSAMSAQCLVCSKADMAGRFMSTRPRLVLWHLCDMPR